MNAVTSLMREANLKPLGKKTLQYLRTRGSLSPLVFWSTYGSMRLAAQIHDLREAGFDISTTMKTDEEGDEYASYRLHEPSRT
jgi:hypothetical protein